MQPPRIAPHPPRGLPRGGRSHVGDQRHVTSTLVEAAPLPGPGTEARRVEAGGGAEQCDEEGHTQHRPPRSVPG
eukprot:scaffold75330_cov54-Phaeocystis_antarctica.AAC.2